MKYPATDQYDTEGYAPPLDPGTYLVSIADIRAKDDKGNKYTDKNGFNYMLFEFEVDGYPGNKLFERICFNPSHQYTNLQLGRFKQLLMALGIPTDREGEFDELLGKTCMAVVVQKQVNDKIVNNIRAYKPAEGVTPAEKSDDDSLPF